MQITTSQPASGKTDPRTNQFLTFSAPASSFLYTGQTQTSFGTLFTAQTILTPVHRFTYNSLGVNTLSPRGNIDVSGDFGSVPTLFANLPACASGIEGMHRAVTDSTTNTWGATVVGLGSFHVEAYCDGTNWTVEGK